MIRSPLLKFVSLGLGLGVTACSSGAIVIDGITLTSDKTVVAADSTDKATLAIVARNSEGKTLPAGSKVTLTTTAGFLDTAGTQTLEFSVTGSSGEFSASLFCTDNAVASVKATSGTATRTVSITCGTGGTGGTTAGSTTGSTAGTTGASTGSTTGGPVVENKSAISIALDKKVIETATDAVVTATLLSTEGNPLTAATPVVFTTSLGSFVVDSAIVGSSTTINSAAGTATATLRAPGAGGNATVTVGFIDSAGVARSASGVVRIVAPGAISIVLEASAATLSTIGSKSTITATLFSGASVVNTTAGPAIANSLSVAMSGPTDIGSIGTNLGGGTVGPDARSIVGIETNASGQLAVDLFAGVVGGTATLQFTYLTTTEIVTVNVIGPPGLASAQFLDADTGTDELRIRVRGSITPNVALLRFLFADAQGRPIPDGQPVQFSLSESASNDVFLTPPSTTTVDGIASVFLNAGAQAETVTVSATASRNGITVSATSPGIAIVGGVPEYSHLSWSCTGATIAIPGLAVDGLDSVCTFQVADRFSNRVDVGTRATFRTEAGNIESSGLVDTAEGSVGVLVRSASPRPRLFVMDRNAVLDANGDGAVVAIAEVPPLRQFFGSNSPVHLISPSGSEALPRISPSGVAPPGVFMASGPSAPNLYTPSVVQKRGKVRFIGVVQGEESFADVNGNKVYDSGEPFVDMAEPFIDKNDNNTRDDCRVGGKPFGYDFSAFPVTVAHSGVVLTVEDYYDCLEDFIDLNGNGIWDAGNGTWDNYTSIWKSAVVTWSDVPLIEMYPAATNSGADIATASGDLFDDTTGALVNVAPTDVTQFGSGANNVLPPPTNFGYAGLYEDHVYRVVGTDQNLNCSYSVDYGSVALVEQLGTAVLTQNPAKSNCDWNILVQDSVTTPRVNESSPPNPQRFATTVRANVTVPYLDLEVSTGWSMKVCPVNDNPAGLDYSGSDLCD